VVTIWSQFDSVGIAYLRHIIGDLIDGQGNLFVAVQVMDSDPLDPAILDVLREQGVRSDAGGTHTQPSLPAQPMSDLSDGPRCCASPATNVDQDQPPPGCVSKEVGGEPATQDLFAALSQGMRLAMNDSINSREAQSFTLSWEWEDGSLLVVLKGELDLDGVAGLADGIDTACAVSPRLDAVDVDLAQLSFVDLSGLRGLAAACLKLQHVADALQVRGASDQLLRLLHISHTTVPGLAEPVPLRPRSHKMPNVASGTRDLSTEAPQTAPWTLACLWSGKRS
jgi:anti-anti-sigma factor